MTTTPYWKIALIGGLMAVLWVYIENYVMDEL